MQKIYYTVGPASVDRAGDILTSGADGVRLTFSFGTPEIQLERAQDVLYAAEKHQLPKPYIIADLEGGGARIGTFSPDNAGESFSVTKDEMIEIVSGDTVSFADQKRIAIPDQKTFTSLSVGDCFVIGDDSAMFTITSVAPKVIAKSLYDGEVESRRSFFVQKNTFDPVCLTAKDRADLEHIAQHQEYDAVALSFVSSAVDVRQAKMILTMHNSTQPIIAKIETQKGLENIAEICAVADQIMVARGDLALALPWQEMPRAVDIIVAECKKQKVPFIMATQVAEGMLHSNNLTRAEMTDLWQWCKAEMSGVLLSRETAWGDRPAEATKRVRTLMKTYDTARSVT